MTPTPRRLLCALLHLALAGLWGVAFVRALSFWSQARSTFIQYNSGDAASDFRWSQAILFCYAASYSIGAFLVWLACRRPSAIAALCTAAAFYFAAHIVASEPESVIVLIPNLAPVFTLLATFILGLVAFAASWWAAQNRRG